MTRSLSLIFAVAVMAGLCQVWLVEAPWHHIYSDIDGYMNRAFKLAFGEPLQPLDTFIPMGLPAFYAIFFWMFDDTGFQVIAVLQIMMMAAVHVLVGLTSYRLFGDRRMALVAAILSLAYWPLTGQLSFYMAEPVCTFLVVAGQYCFVRFVDERGLLWVAGAGLLFGLAATMKTQGWVFAIATLLTLVFWPAARSRLVMWLPVFLLAAMLPLSVQSGQIRSATGADAWFVLPGNGSYNMYNGQSARRGVGTWDNGNFHIYFTSNAYFDDGLLPPIVFNASILDNTFFEEQLGALWRQDPVRQVLRMGVSASELFALQPQWPLRNVEVYSRLEVFFKYLALPVVYLPCFLLLWLSLKSRQLPPQLAYIALPVLGIMAVAALTSGQPRYLNPFLPNLMILAAAGWATLLRSQQRTKSRRQV